MDLGRVFGDAWELARRQWQQLLVGAFAIVVVGSLPLWTLLPLAVKLLSVIEGRDPQAGFRAADVGTSLLAGTVAALGVSIVVVALIVPALEAGVYSGLVQSARRGRTMSFAAAFEGFGFWGAALVARVLAYLAYAGILAVGGLLTAVLISQYRVIGVLGTGLLVFFALVAAGVGVVYLAVCWVYLLPVIVDRGATALGSFTESRTLVHRAGWWRTFGVLIVLQLVLSVVGGVGSPSAGSSQSSWTVIGMVAVFWVLLNSLTTAFRISYISAMYLQATAPEPQATGWGAGRPAQSPWTPGALPVNGSAPPAQAPFGGAPAPPTPAPWSEASPLTWSSRQDEQPPGDSATPPPGTLMPL